MTKNVDSDPDINQLQFILYQYARACHIVEKTKNLESDLDDFNIKDFVYRKREKKYNFRLISGEFSNFHFRFYIAKESNSNYVLEARIWLVP